MRFSRLALSLIASATLLAWPATLAAQVRTLEEQPEDAVPKFYFDRGVSEATSARLRSMRGKSLPAGLDEKLQWRLGEPTDPSAHRGKVVVLQFWRVGHPSWQSWWQRAAVSQRKFQDDVVVIAIHTKTDDPRAARDFIERHEVPVATAIDLNGDVTDLFLAAERPINVLLDRQGAVQYFGLNGRGLDVAIEDLLKRDFDPDAPAPEVFTLPGEGDAGDIGPAPEAPVADADDAGFPPFLGRVSNAKDIRGQLAPQLEVEHWLTDAPNTRGKVLIVDFWATWCGPCKATIPHMNELANRFRPEIAVVGLSDEGLGDLRSFVRQNEMQYAIATDTQGRMKNAIEVRAIPHVLVISPDGIVRFQGHPSSLTADLLEQIVRASAALRG